MLRRPRRNRRHASLRALIAENTLSIRDLVQPLFVHSLDNKEEISSMPNMYRYDIESLIEECLYLHNELGILAVALFPIIPHAEKDALASYALRENNFYLNAVAQIKDKCPDLLVITDVAMDPYSVDGHDGIVGEDGMVANDETIQILQKMAFVQAQAGSDIIAPSDMMDGRVQAIREFLDNREFDHINILSYSAKYASSFYGPFRDALQSNPSFGDKRNYQMDFSNAREALLEAELDVEEGADMLLVKPGLCYLDILYRISEKVNIPVAVYEVSAEYSLLKFSQANKFIDYESCVLERLFAFKRAGASFILSYHSREVAEWLGKSSV